MKPLSLAAALLLSTIALAGCTDALSAPAPAPSLPAHATPSTAPSRPAATSRPRLVFFMNPNGRPCQLQDQVLRGMAAELNGRAEVVYYRTTEGNDLPRFEQFGIRSIPQLVVTDQTGAELRRATPGIQSEPQVRQLIGY
jgi:thioredoxin 1